MCNLSEAVMAKGEARGEARGINIGRAQGIDIGRVQGRAQGRVEGRGEGRAEGIAEGMTKGVVKNTLSSIRNLMETLGLSEDQAMEALKVPKEEQAKYCAMLKQ